ncbi:MAG: restriction endonuclease subunit S [Oscillospiraceae bacterium]|nr:restriction endonuclease subunit S [Oscillospiraceae bacterium]
MSRLAKLIKTLCPNGVDYVPLWSVTIWDKKFMNVDRRKQSAVIKYHYFFADELKSLIVPDGDIKVLTTSTTDFYTVEDHVRSYISNGEVVAIPGGGNANIQYYKGKFVTSDNRIATSSDINILDNKYLYYVLENRLEEISNFYRGSGIKHPNMSKVLDLIIPLPPIEVQREIVRILDSFTKYTVLLKKELVLRKKQYAYYRDMLLDFGDDVEWKTLGEIGKVSMCKRIMKHQTNSESGVPFFKIGTFGKKPDSYISFKLFNEYKQKYSYPKKGDILISASGTIGRTVIFDGNPAYFQDSNIVWIDNNEKIVLNKYLYYFYMTNPWKISEGGTIARLYNDNLEKTEIPIPPIEKQKKIVKILDKFNLLCNDLTNGLPAEINARQKQYEYYRDKLFTFKELK